MLIRSTRSTTEVPAEADARPLIHLQLEQILALQRIRKLSATTQSALARSALAAQQGKLDTADATLCATQHHAQEERGRQREAIARAPRTAKELQRWRNRENSLLADVEQRKAELNEARRQKTHAEEELLRCERVQHRFHIEEEKYASLLEQLAQDE